MWRNISDESRFCLQQLDCWVVWRRKEHWADFFTSQRFWLRRCDGGARLLLTGGSFNAERYRDEVVQPGNPISPQSGTKLYSPRWQCSSPQSAVYQKPPELGRRVGRLAYLQSWPQPQWTFAGSVWMRCLRKSDKCWLKNGTPIHSSVWPSRWPALGGGNRLLWLCMVIQTSMIQSNEWHQTTVKLALPEMIWHTFLWK